MKQIKAPPYAGGSPFQANRFGLQRQSDRIGKCINNNLNTYGFKTLLANYTEPISEIVNVIATFAICNTYPKCIKYSNSSSKYRRVFVVNVILVLER